MRISSIEQKGKEEEGKVEGIYPVWLCVAFEKYVQKAIHLYKKRLSRSQPSFYKALKFMTAKHI